MSKKEIADNSDQNQRYGSSTIIQRDRATGNTDLKNTEISNPYQRQALTPRSMEEDRESAQFLNVENHLKVQKNLSGQFEKQVEPDSVQLVKPAQQNQSKKWIYQAFGAVICFAACNAVISEVTAKSGPLCIFYFAFGSMLSGGVYNFYHSFKNWRGPSGKFWLNQQLIVNGQLRCKSLFGFLLYCLFYFLVQNMAFNTMWFAGLAKINVGLITVIWNINPLYMAAVDYLLFNNKMKYFHVVGTSMIIICSVLLSLKSYFVTEMPSDGVPKPAVVEESEAPKIVEDGQVLPTWIPVLFGILTPVCFCSISTLLRFLTDESKGYNFNSATVSMSGAFATNLIIIIIAIVFWQYHHFSAYLFWLGLIGSIINTCGLTFINQAFANGPMGPVASINTLTNLILVVVEAIKHMKVPSYIEFIALVLGLMGALELVIPEQIEKLFSCCCLASQKKKQLNVLQNYQDQEEELIDQQK